MKAVTLANIADKAANELFAHELKKVMENIDDPNTEAIGARKLVLTFTFDPDHDRHEIRTTVEVKSKLMGVKGCTRTTFLGKRNGEPTLYGQDTKQINMFDDGVDSIDHLVEEKQNA